MGDIVSLVEKAAETIDAEKAAAMAQKMAKGKFDLNDLAEQLRQMQKMGGMGGIMGMMPGMGKMKDQLAGAGFDDKMFKRQIAIIQSMTRAERANPDILKHSAARSASPPAPAPMPPRSTSCSRCIADGRHDEGHGRQGQGRRHDARMMGGLASKMGLGGMGGMPDLSKMDPRQLEALAKQAEAAGFKPGGGLPPGLGGGMPGLGGQRLPGLGGGFPGLPGLPKKK
jgi:signal recognition particle subunit SRP54